MELNEKMLKLARTAKTPEELQALAEENQIVLSEEQARDLFDGLNQTGALADEELDGVAGGRWSWESETKPPEYTYMYYAKCKNCSFVGIWMDYQEDVRLGLPDKHDRWYPHCPKRDIDEKAESFQYPKRR